MVGYVQQPVYTSRTPVLQVVSDERIQPPYIHDLHGWLSSTLPKYGELQPTPHYGYSKRTFQFLLTDIPCFWFLQNNPYHPKPKQAESCAVTKQPTRARVCLLTYVNYICTYPCTQNFLTHNTQRSFSRVSKKSKENEVKNTLVHEITCAYTHAVQTHNKQTHVRTYLDSFAFTHTRNLTHTFSNKNIYSYGLSFLRISRSLYA